MIPVSDNFKDAIISPSRETRAYIEFEILDVDSNTDATPTVTSEEEFSKKSQIYNQIRTMSGKYATWENDYFKLDGSFGLPPKPSETGFEVGWWSDTLCAADGTFTPSQVITSQFTIDHSSIGLTITFDTLTNEYASDFTIVAYDAADSIIHTETVVDNTLSKYILETNLLNFRKIVVTITKWATGNRRARITEIDFGIIKTYTDDEIINMDILEEIDVISDQVTSNEIKFTLDNQDKSFNILNPQGVYPFLQRKQKLKAYIGPVIAGDLVENVPLGVHYLTEWNSDEGSLTASFTARDILDISDQNEFPETTYTSKTIKYILEDILSNVGITDYVIDSALDLIIVSGTLPKSTNRVALQTTAIAGMAVMYCDRYGILQIKQLSTTSSVDTIDFNNTYSSPQIKLDKLVNTIDVVYGASTYTLVDPDKPISEQTLAVKIENPFVSTLDHATDLANWVLTEIKKRFLYDINWRQNPALESGDIVTVQDDYTENRTVRITKQELSYQGYLSGKTSGRGG